MKTKRLLAVFFASILCSASAAPGDLDPTFGTAGAVDFTIGPSKDTVRKLVMHPDGKMTVVGRIDFARQDAGYVGVDGPLEISGPTRQLAIARYNADGSLDATFGSGGLVRYSDGRNIHGADAVLQADGGLIVLAHCGETVTSPPVTGYPACLLRFTPVGSLDAGFSVDPSAFADRLVSALALQPDGKIVAAFQRTSSNCSSCTMGFGALRFLPSGALDTSFGDQGVAIHGFPIRKTCVRSRCKPTVPSS